jgi:hypothetical protein
MAFMDAADAEEPELGLKISVVLVKDGSLTPIP